MNGFHVGAFDLKALDDSPGLAFGKAVEACRSAAERPYLPDPTTVSSPYTR